MDLRYPARNRVDRVDCSVSWSPERKADRAGRPVNHVLSGGLGVEGRDWTSEADEDEDDEGE